MKNSLLLAGILSFLLLASACEEEKPHHPEGYGLQVPDSKMGKDKLVIYQMMTRLFGNKNNTNKTYGTLAENGCGKFSDVTEKALEELRKMGFTHVWYTGVLEHATMTDFSEDGILADDADVVKGRAGSPYAIKDYYDVAPSLANTVDNRMSEFQGLIQRTHKQGMKVIMDFVPNHVARSYHSDAKPIGTKDLGEDDDNSLAFSVSNNFLYLPGTSFQVPEDHDPLGEEIGPDEDDRYTESPAKVTGNNVFSHAPAGWDWFETAKLNYGVDFQNDEAKHFDPIPDTWTKMRDILLYWADKGVDAFRCDMAEMVPVEFWAWAIPEVKEKHEDIVFIAEIYNPNAYKDYVEVGKFDYLYDKVGVYDTIRELMSGGGNTAKIAAALAQSEGIEQHMLRFLENHDEQRIASEAFAGTPWAAVPGMTVSALMGKGPILIYFGQESGEPGKGEEGFQKEDGRTTIFDYWGVPEHQKWMNGGKFDGGQLSEEQLKLREFYKNLLYLCRFDEAIQTGAFSPLPMEDPHVYGFFRHTDNKKLLVLANFDRESVKEATISKASWEAVGLNANAAYHMEAMLDDSKSMDMDGEVFAADGSLRVQIEPLGALVLSIEPK